MSVPFLPELLDNVARLVQSAAGVEIARRRGINLIASTNVAVAAVDNPALERVDYTLSVASAAPSGAAGGTLGGTYPNPTVNTDGSTLETNASALRVKDLGITQAKLASGYRAIFVGTSAPGSPTEGDLWFDTTNNLLMVYNGTAWVTITPKTATVATSETRANSAFGALATSGPAVSVQTGTKALVTTAVRFSSATTTGLGVAAPAVSGATTRAAVDADGAQASMGVANQSILSENTVIITGLTAGINTFTLQYRVSDASTFSFLFRSITVVGIPD